MDNFMAGEREVERRLCIQSVEKGSGGANVRGIVDLKIETGDVTHHGSEKLVSQAEPNDKPTEDKRP